MAEYIEPKARYIDINKVRIPKGFFDDLNMPKLFDWLNSQPAADVEPVRHGEWIDTDTFDFHCVHIYQCSNCGKEVADDYIDNHKFCLHFGAKMDGGKA